MMPNRHLGDAHYGSAQKNNSSSEQDLTGLSALIRRELEVLVIRAVEQLIQPILKPLIRGIVKEEIESAQENILTSSTRNLGNEIHPSESGGYLQLRFSNKISQHVMTGEQIKGEVFNSIKVALVDVLTGQVVTSGPLASAKVEMVVLKGDFDADELEEDWTLEEFNKNIVIGLDGKRILLNGKTRFNLKEGVGVLDEISFKHSSSWMKSCKLRLGARVESNNPNGSRVREAKTKCFTLMDRRNNLYKKHHPPSLGDDVWRLERIAKEGCFHKRLSKEKVNTVKDFLKLFFLDPARLRNILGMGTSSKTWEVIVDHAQTCILDKMLYLYCPPASQGKTGVVFSVVGQLMGLLSECRYVLIDMLSETEKADARKLVISAFEHWDDVVSLDEDACLRDGFSGLSKVLYPSISSKRASSDGDKILTCHKKKTRFEYPQPSVSSPDIISSIYSIGGLSSFHDFGLHRILSSFRDFVNIRCDRTLSFPVCDTESISQKLDAIQSLQSQNLSWDSPANLDSAVNCFLVAPSTTGVRALRKWRILYDILSVPNSESLCGIPKFILL